MISLIENQFDNDFYKMIDFIITVEWFAEQVYRI